MDASSPRWTTVSDSPHDHEREALAFLRRRLYDLDPYRVWANFAFDAHLRATLSPAACHQVFGSDPTDDATVLATELTDVELREAMSPDDFELDAEA